MVASLTVTEVDVVRSHYPVPIKINAQVAQLVEQRTENPRVGGSIPSLGTMEVGVGTQGGLINLLAPDQRSRLGSTPSTSTNLERWASGLCLQS